MEHIGDTVVVKEQIYIYEIQSGTGILDFKSTAKSSVEVNLSIIGVAENV